MGAGVLCAVPFDDAGVGGVGEDFAEALPANRRWGFAAGAAVGEAPVGEFGGQCLQGPVAGGVMLEPHDDQRCPVGVGDDPGDLVAGDGFAGVEVAEWGGVREAALFGFLGHAFTDFVSEVGRVELGHQRVDTFDEAAGGGLFHVFGDGDERDAAFTEQGTDRYVVFHVAGEPVNFVDDDRFDVTVFGDPVQHGFERWPVRGPGGFASVGVFVDEFMSGVTQVTDGGFALGGDGEPFFALSFFGLFTGGHPQVQHAPHVLNFPS